MGNFFDSPHLPSLGLTMEMATRQLTPGFSPANFQTNPAVQSQMNAPPINDFGASEKSKKTAMAVTSNLAMFEKSAKDKHQPLNKSGVRPTNLHLDTSNYSVANDANPTDSISQNSTNGGATPSLPLSSPVLESPQQARGINY